jgi:hypothetical protein
MDVVLGGFLAWVRPRARPAHLSTYEELAWQLDTFLRHQPRARRLRSAALCGFVGSWYARECRPEGRSARRFCAALRVLAELGRDADPVRAQRMRFVVARAGASGAGVARFGAPRNACAAPPGCGARWA